MANLGRTYELRLRRLLEDRGFTVRQCSSSEFPDLICWDDTSVFFIEVKRVRTKGSRDTARYKFKKAVEATRFPEGCSVQLWLYGPEKGWHIYEWVDGKLIAKPLAAGVE